jgi:predicted transcriptional regulator
MVFKTLELGVTDFITPRPITVKDSHGFLDSVQIMAEKGIGNLIVVKNRNLIDIFTERQILGYVTNI